MEKVFKICRVKEKQGIPKMNERMDMEKKTPLYDLHVSAGGKIVPFAGYLLPVEYSTGLMREHEAVRTTCGLFDVSHMGEISFTGKDALETLNYLMTNDFSNLAVGRCRYTALCYEEGGMVDDLIVYRRGEEEFLAVVNAANKDRDFAWMREHSTSAVTIEDHSDSYAQLALQGPCASDILAHLVDAIDLPEKHYSFNENIEVAGVPCLISRTGYTGEDGFELYFSADKAADVWNALLVAGKPHGLIPCGLGARDTLRFEAGMPLYGHEMSETIDPEEAGIGFAVKLNKPRFIGKDVLVQKDKPARTRIGLEVSGRGIIREHAPLFFEGKQIGSTTSGTYCPTLSKACAMALVTSGTVSQGDRVEAEVRGRMIEARVVALPFYKRKH